MSRFERTCRQKDANWMQMIGEISGSKAVYGIWQTLSQQWWYVLAGENNVRQEGFRQSCFKLAFWFIDEVAIRWRMNEHIIQEEWMSDGGPYHFWQSSYPEGPCEAGLCTRSSLLEWELRRRQGFWICLTVCVSTGALECMVWNQCGIREKVKGALSPKGFNVMKWQLSKATRAEPWT